jgi:hypothetical protein
VTGSTGATGPAGSGSPDVTGIYTNNAVVQITGPGGGGNQVPVLADGFTFTSIGTTISITQTTQTVGSGQTLSIVAQATSAASATGGELSFAGGASTGAGGIGGTLLLQGGAGTTTGGKIIVNAGSGVTPGKILFDIAGTTLLTLAQTSATAGTVTFGTFYSTSITITQAGVASGNGAILIIQGQSTTAAAATGGGAVLGGGNSTGAGGIGGNVEIQGGTGDTGSGVGGSVFLATGNGASPGSIQFVNFTTTWLTAQFSGGVGTLQFSSTVAGIINIATGTSFGTGQSITITAQNMTAASAVGGAVIVSGGPSSGTSGIGGAVTIRGGSAGGSTSTGGAVIIQPGNGTTVGGDTHVNLSNGAAAFRVDGTNSLIAVSLPLVGDTATNDSLRFGVSAFVTVTNADVVVSNTAYRNFTIKFNGTITGTVRLITLPAQAGYTKLLDFSQANTTGVGTLVVAAGAVTSVIVPGTGGAVGPIVLLSFDGTNLSITNSLN